MLRIIKTMFLYLILAHFIACMWIEVSKIEDNREKSWLRRAPVVLPTGTRNEDSIDLSDNTIYIHAIYWSIVTFSHIGIGDITAVTAPERAFNCAVILIYTFAYAVLFGNMASLVSELTGSMRSKLHEEYTFIFNFLEKKGLPRFKTQIEEYYNTQWILDSGIKDTEILQDLPAALKGDVLVDRYGSALMRSPIFTDESGVLNR
jgi:hypothetical protein